MRLVPLLALAAPASIWLPLVAVASIHPGNQDGKAFETTQDYVTMDTLSSTSENLIKNVYKAFIEIRVVCITKRLERSKTSHGEKEQNSMWCI